MICTNLFSTREARKKLLRSDALSNRYLYAPFERGRIPHVNPIVYLHDLYIVYQNYNFGKRRLFSATARAVDIYFVLLSCIKKDHAHYG